MTKALLGIIGGSGVYDLPGLTDIREEKVASPWGEPSDALRFGRIGETEAVFLPRHGRGHRLSPSGINYRANIDALKRVGVTDVISVSACGSFREELPPGMFVVVDQFVDRTFGRQTSFFGNGCVAHVSMAQPVAPLLQHRAGRRRPRREHRRASRAGPMSAWRGRNSPPGGIAGLQGRGLFGDRHDRAAGSQARARGGNVLRDAGHGHRFRLLA